MITGSPHVYRRIGAEPKLSRPRELLDAALAQAAAVEERGLASVLTLNHLAHRTGVSYGYLRRIVERSIDPYQSLEITQRSRRRVRIVSSPEPLLMEVQRWMLRRILARIPTHPASCAYGPGQSIRDCAARHSGARWLVKLDIANFFESISEARVYKVFVAAGYQPLPAFELARLCTRSAAHADHVNEHDFRSRKQYTTIPTYNHPYMGFLPQGAPTSGAIANLVAHPLDECLAELARRRDFVYTRYADDMTFSSAADFNRSAAVRFTNSASQLVRRQGFTIQESKTRIVPPGSRKIVLGLLVDGDTPRISVELRRRLTNHVRGVEKFGLAAHRDHWSFSSLEGFVRHVSGLIAFAADIEPEWAGRLEERWRTALKQNHWG